MTDERLYDVAVILRSKLAGPFLLSLEAFFSSSEDMRRVRLAGAVTEATVAAAYGIEPEDVRSITWYDVVPAVKCVIWSPIRADSSRCRDVYGSQSHLPFGDLQTARGDLA